MYSFQKAKRFIDLQSNFSLKVLNMAKNTFISDFKSSTLSGNPFLFPMHAWKHQASEQIYPFQFIFSISLSMAS